MWLANAIVAAILLRAQFDRWGELVAAAFFANLAAHVVSGDPIAFGLARSALKVAEFLIVVIPIQRRFGTDVKLHDIRQLVFFLFYAGLVAPLASVAGLAVHTGLAVGAVDSHALGTWFMSHALGYLILTPLLLTIPNNLAPFMAPRQVIIERLMIIMVTASAAVWVYSHHAPVQWAIIPLLVLAAFRLPPWGVALTIAIVAVIATVSTSSGNGPIAAASFDATGRILLLQAFIATAGLVALSISAIIGERDRLLAEVIVARDEARAAADAKSKFLATMSHEIRTPMTGVLGMIELLRSDPPDAEKELYFETLGGSANLLMTVLDDILDFSKIEGGNVVLEDIDFSLEDLAQSTRNLFGSGASQKGLLLSLHCTIPKGEFVRGDPIRIQQVMSNLINNAIKFTERGRITINVTSTVLDLARRRIRVEVIDTGIGIAADNATRLFEPFVQAETSTTRRFGGTGLGLAISRWLIDAMGGTIGVETTIRKGSTFWFELSLQQGLGPQWQAPPLKTPVAARSLDILVAEDNPVNQMLIEAILRRLGHRSTLATDGRQAVEIASTNLFDCILMDMQMPEMDGLAATRLIRASDGPCANVPIIALTADASMERRRFYDHSGLTDFMAKPIDRLALAARLAAIAAPQPEETPTSDPINAGPPTVDFSIIDATKFNQLCDVIGPTSFDRLLDLLQVEMAERPAAIRLAILAGKQALARQEAHSLKGASISVGAVALGRAAAVIESAGDLATMSAALPALDRQTMLTRQAIEALIPRTFPNRDVA